MEFVKYTETVTDMRLENGVMVGNIIQRPDGVHFVSSISNLYLLRPSDFRDLANMLDELNE